MFVCVKKKKKEGGGNVFADLPVLFPNNSTFACHAIRLALNSNIPLKRSTRFQILLVRQAILAYLRKIICSSTPEANPWG